MRTYVYLDGETEIKIPVKTRPDAIKWIQENLHGQGKIKLIVREYRLLTKKYNWVDSNYERIHKLL